MQKDLVEEIKVLEGLFYDQLQFSLMSVFNFQRLGKGKDKEIVGFLKQLKQLTLENIYICDKYL